METAHDPDFALAAGTLAFWARPDATGTLQGMVGKDAIQLGAGEMSVLLRADGRVSFRLETETKTFYAQSQRALEAGDWTHVAVSWGAAGMQVHLDGVLDGTAAHAGGLAGNAQPWVIGANASASAEGGVAGLRDHFRGTIDEVALFDRQLGAADLAALAGAGDDGGAAATRAPVVASGVPDRSATVGQAFAFAPPADAFADPDGDALSLTATTTAGGALPGWLGFDGVRFTGTPPAGGQGTLALRVTASDGEATVWDDFVLTIDAAAPRPPPSSASPARPAGPRRSTSRAASGPTRRGSCRSGIPSRAANPTRRRMRWWKATAATCGRKITRDGGFIDYVGGELQRPGDACPTATTRASAASRPRRWWARPRISPGRIIPTSSC